MNIPTIVNFKDLQTREIFDSSSKEYKALKRVNENGDWKDYVNQMISAGITVRFDSGQDFFIVTPVGPVELKENDEQIMLQDDEDIDIESNDDDLSSVMSQQVEEEEINTQDTMQVISLEDVMALLKQVLPQAQPAQTESQPQMAPATSTPEGVHDPLVDMKEQTLEDSDEALMRSFFQDEQNETLDSEFHTNKEKVQNIETSIENGQSYIEIINGMPQSNVDDQQISTASANETSVSMTMPEPAICDPMSSDFHANAEVDDTVTGITDEGQEGELLLDTEGEPEPLEEEMNEAPMGPHPDLERIVGGVDYDESDDDEFEPMSAEPMDFEYGYEEPMAEPEIAPVDTTMHMGGQTFRVILTGVILAENEIKYIKESVTSAGGKLKAIKGEGNELNIVLEANGSQYTINYVDLPKNKTKTPFSIKKYKFQTLEEALDRINYKQSLKEAEIFKTIIGEDISHRSLNEITESNIFEGINENVNYVSSWNVKSVGSINLKNGLNEVFSNVLQHGAEPNTLVRTQNNEYYLFKGNLKERSKAGTVRELIEMKSKKTIGMAEVVGLYENTAEGLGEIMFEIKRTSIPMLVWK